MAPRARFYLLARNPPLPDRLLLDIDPARRSLGALRDADLQHAVLAAGLDAVRVGAVGQREAAIEHAVRALVARPAFAFGLGFALALALDRQHALVHVDFDRRRIDARQV